MSRLIDPIELKRSISISNILEDGKTIEELIDEQPDAMYPDAQAAYYEGKADAYKECAKQVERIRKMLEGARK